MPYLIIIVDPSRFLPSTLSDAFRLEFQFPNKRKTSLSGGHDMKAVFHSRLSIGLDNQPRLRRGASLLPLVTQTELERAAKIYQKAQVDHGQFQKRERTGTGFIY